MAFERIIDEIDGSILDILQYNARTTQAELAKAVGLAPSAVLERLRKLESKGIIKDYVALIDPHVVDSGHAGVCRREDVRARSGHAVGLRAVPHPRSPRGPPRRRRRLLPAQGARARCRASRSDSSPADRRGAVGDVHQDDDRARDGEGGSAHLDSEGTDPQRLHGASRDALAAIATRVSRVRHRLHRLGHDVSRRFTSRSKPFRCCSSRGCGGWRRASIMSG